MIDLDSLDKTEQDNLEDSLFNEGEKKLFGLQTMVDETIEKIDEDIEGLLEDENYDETCDEYHELVYQKEAYEIIKDKFLSN